MRAVPRFTFVVLVLVVADSDPLAALSVTPTPTNPTPSRIASSPFPPQQRTGGTVVTGKAPLPAKIPSPNPDWGRERERVLGPGEGEWAVLRAPPGTGSGGAPQEGPQGRPQSKSPNAGKSDDILAGELFDTQRDLLDAWESALEKFDKVLSSATDEETKSDFAKAALGYFKERVVGEMIARSNVVGGGDAFGLLSALVKEADRVQGATASAALRDFYVKQKDAIDRYRRKVGLIRGDFLQAVQDTKKRGGREAEVMHEELVGLYDALKERQQRGTEARIFQDVTELWIRESRQGRGNVGLRPSFVLIRMNEDLTIIDATVIAPGGEKIAEQLNKYNSDRVDVIRMNVPKRFVIYKQGNDVPAGKVERDFPGRATLILGVGRTLEDRLSRQGPKGLPGTVTKLSGRERE